MTVSPDTIAVALGTATPVQGSVQARQWALWAQDALMLIESRRVKLGAAPLDQDVVDYVVREAVVAQAKRPDDATQVTVSVDDASTSKTYRSGKGRVSILEEWWTLLGLTAPTGSAFSVDTTPVLPEVG